MLHSVHNKYGVHFSSLHFVQWYHDSHAGQSQVSPSSGSAYKSPFRLKIKPSPCKMNHFNWVHTSAHAPLPPNAVYAGNDTDGSPIYVGRAWVLKNPFILSISTTFSFPVTTREICWLQRCYPRNKCPMWAIMAWKWPNTNSKWVTKLNRKLKMSHETEMESSIHPPDW